MKHSSGMNPISVKKKNIKSFFFQAEDGIRDAQESRGLGDVYKRQGLYLNNSFLFLSGYHKQLFTLCHLQNFDWVFVSCLSVFVFLE